MNLTLTGHRGLSLRASKEAAGQMVWGQTHIYGVEYIRPLCTWFSIYSKASL